MNEFARALRPTETEASPYAGYQLAYEVKKLMYDKTFSNHFFFFVLWSYFCATLAFTL